MGVGVTMLKSNRSPLYHVQGDSPKAVPGSIAMRVGLMTKEYPPNVYGGAGVHVEYLSRELAKLIEVEVHAWGKQDISTKPLRVLGEEPWDALKTDAKFTAALEALSLNLLQMTSLGKIDIVHTHTWYVSMAGFWAKSCSISPSSSPRTRSNPCAPGRRSSLVPDTP